MGITTNNPTARLLDLTRLTSRAGRAMTGVDRVEFAYLDRLLNEGPLYGLVRSSRGFILLDAKGCAAFRDAVATGDWGTANLVSRIGRIDAKRAAAETFLRKICLDRCLPNRLARMLGRHLGAAVTYLNIGHSNLSNRVVSALRSLPDCRIATFVHDTIPLDFPQYQRAGSVEKFRVFFDRTLDVSDIVICNSAQTVQDMARHASGLLPETVMAHLGVDLPQPGTPPVGKWSAPYFVTIGTIEPRKNHRFLLEMWDNIPDADLLICGNRGWNNQEVFGRLDAGQNRVFELNNLPDDALFGLVQNAAGMLFPSFAEGFGLPPAEAASLGVPVICNDLPIYREFLNDIPVYLDVGDRYLWETTIKNLAKGHRTKRKTTSTQRHYVPPTWDAHFDVVLQRV